MTIGSRNPIPNHEVNPYFYLNFYLVLIAGAKDVGFLLLGFAIGLFLISLDLFFNKQFKEEYEYMKIGTVFILMFILIKIIWLPIWLIHS